MRIHHIVTKFPDIITKDDIVIGCITCTIKLVYIHEYIHFMISKKYLNTEINSISSALKSLTYMIYIFENCMPGERERE